MIPITSRLRCRRTWAVHLFVLSAWVTLLLRLLHIQILSQATYASQALRQQTSHEVMPARPGDLLDRKGRLLATTIRVPSLYVNPSRIDDPDAVASTIGRIVGRDEQALADRIRNAADRQFLWVKRHLSEEQAEALRQADLPVELFGFRSEFKRHYPQGKLAAHVIGLRDIDGLGRGGAEQAFDPVLRGRDGVRRFVRDARGHVLEILEEVTQPPQDGQAVALTIDTVMQLRTEHVLEDLMEDHSPVGATAIVLDPNNGEVLAMASRPAFDPTRPGAARPADWKNLAISAVYEPGSTFKPLVVAWGLDRGQLHIDEQFDCEMGLYQMGSRILHDHHRYGELSLTDVLVKSSNIGMAKIGERMGNEQLYSLTTAFGFGQRTGIELQGEVSGLVLPLDRWTSYSTGSIPMGHEIAVTPLQMIAAHAVLANGGRRISPHLLLKTSQSAKQPRQVVISEVISSDVAEWVVQNPMRQVVQRGTGTKAQLKGVDLFGKTGTAQKVKPDGGYSSQHNVCSFVCGAPAENPRLLVLVCVDEPRGPSQFGGTVAAPYAARILAHCLPHLD